MSSYVKSVSGRTVWEVDNDGCLHERGPNSPAFRISASDTRLLLLLLTSEQDVIFANAELEAKTGNIPQNDVTPLLPT